MSQYYLMAQLPSLDGISDASPLPITEAKLTELCSRFLGKRALQAFSGLSLTPERNGGASGYKLIDAWNEGERQLRLALAVVRAEKLKKPFDKEETNVPGHLLQTAQTAVQLEDPMEAEQFLNQVRLKHLENLRPMDPFADDAVFYYGLKLKLLSRLRSFDEQRGRQAYRTIYHAILRGDEKEAQE